MPKKQLIIDAPSHPVVRSRWLSERSICVDFRGIRTPLQTMNGRPNPTKGEPRKFLSPEHLQNLVNEYWESCMGYAFGKDGMPLRKDGEFVKAQVKPYTVSGLALYLGISTVSLRKYELGKIDSILDEMRAETDDKLTFARVLTAARQRIEAYAEGRLYDHEGQRGAQFVLDCQFGWTGRRDAAEIKRNKIDTKLRREEFELKKKLLDEGDGDNEFTINIVRANKEEEQ